MTSVARVGRRSISPAGRAAALAELESLTPGVVLPISLQSKSIGTAGQLTSYTRQPLRRRAVVSTRIDGDTRLVLGAANHGSGRSAGEVIAACSEKKQNL